MGGEVAKADPVLRLQAALMQFEQRECPVGHLFSPGLYLRTIVMPADTFVIGKLHATEHPNILISGDVTVWTAQDGVHRLQGPKAWVSGAGVKKVLYTHTDCVWMTAHATDKTDLIELEDQLIIPDECLDWTPEELEAVKLELLESVRAAMTVALESAA
jgi:hypothetical protein